MFNVFIEWENVFQGNQRSTLKSIYLELWRENKSSGRREKSIQGSGRCCWVQIRSIMSTFVLNMESPTSGGCWRYLIKWRWREMRSSRRFRCFQCLSFMPFAKPFTIYMKSFLIQMIYFYSSFFLNSMLRESREWNRLRSKRMERQNLNSTWSWRIPAVKSLFSKCVSSLKYIPITPVI